MSCKAATFECRLSPHQRRFWQPPTGAQRPAGHDPKRPFATMVLNSRSHRDHHRSGLVRGASMDVGDWLRSLGLGKYETMFRESDIDAQVLPELSESDFEKLGVSLGHRKRLLKAIANLGATASAAKPANPAPTSTGDAERRRLTVMFVDLVGSTALSAELDPEDMREVIRVYQNTVAGEVTRFEGHIAKYMGDGVLAYFGWPRAHEDEAERSARAGLAVVQAVARLQNSRWRDPTDAHRRRNGASRSRRSHRRGRRAGAGGRRRHAESGGATARRGRARYGGHFGVDPRPDRQSVRSARSRTSDAKGHSGTNPSICCALRTAAGEPVRGEAVG